MRFCYIYICSDGDIVSPVLYVNILSLAGECRPTKANFQGIVSVFYLSVDSYLHLFHLEGI